MADLEAEAKESAGTRFRLIATDGVFSMDGYLANLPGSATWRIKHDALVRWTIRTRSVSWDHTDAERTTNTR